MANDAVWNRFISELLDKNDIVDVISSYIDVKPKGRGYWALCPFHNDRNPSLSINREGQYFHCFVCGVGGNAIRFIMKYESCSFIEAVETILGRAAVKPPVFHRQKDEKPRELLLPVLNDTADRVIRYLKGRGIHPVIIDYCLKNKLLFESRDYHNAVFIGYDPQGKMRYGNVRGTMGDYKGDLSGSDKHYSFAILGESDTVHLFESAIDLLSFATLELLEGRDWRQNHLLSLAGVYKTKRTDVVPIALEQYLKDHPGVKTLRLHLDNDEIGRGAAAGIISGLNGRYQVFDEPPRYGKDVNDRLKMKIGMMKKDDLSR